MRRYCNIVLMVILLMTEVTLQAQTFKMERLGKAASVTGIINLLDSLPAGCTSSLPAKDGLTLCIRKTEDGTIEHIGIPLFQTDMRLLIPSPVYDFMEYAVLNKHYKVNPNDLYLSKVLFQKGNWQTLIKKQLQDCKCSISNQDDQLYIVSWLREDQEEAVVGVPIDYELLNNDSRRNIEHDFIRHLSAYDVQPIAPKAITEDDLKVYGTEGLFSIPGESYIMPELNSNVYYELRTISEEIDTVYQGKLTKMTLEAVAPFIAISDDYPAETMANLLLSDEVAVSGTRLKLDFHLSDYHREVVDVTAFQLRDFCRHEGCKIYFAYKGIRDGVLRGTLMVSNLEKGYNHLFSLRMPADQLTATEPELQADVYLYIPPIDKSKLFGKVPTKKSGAQIY